MSFIIDCVAQERQLCVYGACCASMRTYVCIANTYVKESRDTGHFCNPGQEDQGEKDSGVSRVSQRSCVSVAMPVISRFIEGTLLQN